MGVVQLRSQLQVNTLEIEEFSEEGTETADRHRSIPEPAESDAGARTAANVHATRLRVAKTTLWRSVKKRNRNPSWRQILEKRQEGQQFRLADPPNLPTRPSSPKRLKISLIALVGGLAFGCALAFLAETKNPSFHSEDDARSRCDIASSHRCSTLLSPPLSSGSVLEREHVRVVRWMRLGAFGGGC